MSNSLFLLNNERKPVAEVVHLFEPQEPLCPLNDAIKVHCHNQQKTQLKTSKINARVLGYGLPLLPNGQEIVRL